MKRAKPRDLAACCGLYCGLCPRFQSTAPSRCSGCHLAPVHDYCGVYRCCVTKRGFHTCAECEEYPCDRLIGGLGIEKGLDSFVSHKPAQPNLERIRRSGLARHLAGQEARRAILEELLRRWNDGRSMSLYCRAAALLPTQALRRSVDRTERAVARARVAARDRKARAAAMREALADRAAGLDVDLALRSKKREKGS
jgi:hypothetical protein